MVNKPPSNAKEDIIYIDGLLHTKLKRSKKRGLTSALANMEKDVVQNYFLGPYPEDWVGSL